MEDASEVSDVPISVISCPIQIYVKLRLLKIANGDCALEFVDGMKYSSVT
jgi:hypothetical protein